MINVETQLILYWIAVGFCFLGTVSFLLSISFQKEGMVKYGILCSWLALFPMVTALGLRWLETGHVPSIGAYEVFTIYAGGVLLFYLIVRSRKPSLNIAGVIVLPVVMLMTGIGIMSSTELTVLPNTYFTYWLWIHMLFATLALGGVLISAGLGGIYLVKNRQEARGRVNSLLATMPELAKLDYLSYRFAIFAFGMMGIMIASGSIWGYKSWGRYWGWDPIETWSLICWLAYGIYLHLRRIGLKGQNAAWLNFALIAIAIFCFFGAPYLYPTIHDRFVK